MNEVTVTISANTGYAAGVTDLKREKTDGTSYFREKAGHRYAYLM